MTELEDMGIEVPIDAEDEMSGESERELRSVRVAVNLRPSEYEVVLEKARGSGLKPSRYIVLAALETPILTEPTLEDMEAWRELRAIGKNLNQVARDLSRLRNLVADQGLSASRLKQLTHLIDRSVRFNQAIQRQMIAIEDEFEARGTQS